MEAPEDAAWNEAVDQVEAYLRAPSKLSEQWDEALAAADQRHQRWLVWGVFRHWRRYNEQLAERLRKPPRPRLKALLLVALSELEAADSERRAQVIHFAVERAKQLSAAEARLVNAVLRGLLRDAPHSGDVAWETSHPDWMARRWVQQWGQAAAEKLMRWNQQAADHYLHWLDRSVPLPVDAGLEVCDWPGFYRIGSQGWDAALAAVRSGRACIQDPATRHPVELLAPVAGERVLDLCAAPGGKTQALAHALDGQGVLKAVDLPGRRLRRLDANLEALRQRFPQLDLEIGALDVLRAADSALAAGWWEHPFDAVLLDAPCSNTGVIRRKPDVRMRLQPRDLKALPELQLALLEQAAQWLRPGGRLVYSTCSIESEENDELVSTFLKRNPAFGESQRRLSFPWRDAHDGGGAFLLTRSAGTS